MQVKLLTSKDSLAEMEHNAAYGALTCHANQHRDFTPSDVLKRIIKAGHESVLEHITLTFKVNNISRACLQELARHRHISLSVESTRHTLRKRFEDVDELIHTSEKILPVMIKGTECVSAWHQKYIQWVGEFAKENPDITNDMLKYYMPEFWPTNLVLTVNIRELRHILTLRSTPAALREFQKLVHALFDAVPETFQYLLENCLYKEVINDGK